MFIVTLSLEGLPTKAEEAPSPHEVKMAPLDTNPVFQCLRVNLEEIQTLNIPNKRSPYLCFI